MVPHNDPVPWQLLNATCLFNSMATKGVDMEPLLNQISHPGSENIFPSHDLGWKKRLDVLTHSWSVLSSAEGYTLVRLVKVLISNVLAKHTVQLSDGNKYGKTSWYLLKSCPPRAIWPCELEREKYCYPPCSAGWTWGVCAVSFLPWGLTLCHSEQCQPRPRSGVDGSQGQSNSSSPVAKASPPRLL